LDRGADTTLVSRGPLAVGAPSARLTRRLLGLLLLLFLAAAAWSEARTSRVQAWAASRVAEHLAAPVLGGKNPALQPARGGPFDERRGYTRVHEHVARLEAAGFQVLAQARPTARAEWLARIGLPAIYGEKTRAGLRIEGRDGPALSQARFPRRAFPDFRSLPAELVETLLFIENRALLEPGFPHRSPVIEWDRLAHAALLQVLPHEGGRRPGASTLAIQIEKYRHSPGGVTPSIPEKLRQIGAATLRVYQDGTDTTRARRRIVTGYVNTVPLAARPGFGEVHGIPDGLWAWFGADHRETARALASGTVDERALAYRRVLSLFLAQRRPSHYLRAGRTDLHALVDRHLHLLARAGVIDPALRDAALAVRPGFVDAAPPWPDAASGGGKAARAVRTELLGLLGVAGTYDLDRLDARVATSLDARAQAEVAALLDRLGDPDDVGGALRGPRLLGDADPGRVVWSFLLYEREGDANVLRVQADTLDQPFDVNEGMKLDLGSTAKLRTLAHYLELVATAWDRYAGRAARELWALDVHRRDGLSRWVVAELARRPGASRADLVEAALDRRFSARPATFWTGGGAHPFGNYDAAFDGQRLPLRLALRHSVNLPFVRLLDEIVDHLAFGPAGGAGDVLDDPGHPARRAYLERFAHAEGLAFLDRFMARHRGRTPLEREAILVEGARREPWRVAVLYRSLHPTGGVAGLHRFLERHLGRTFPGHALRRWHAEADPGHLSRADRSWLTGVHPLELWLVAHWTRHPEADRTELLRASAPVRRESSAWLYRTGKRAQDLRIRTVLERDAFREVHAAWTRHGYPFDRLVPSLATAIGSSADRPAALAELLGIIQNDGLRLAHRRIEAVQLAGGTPWETRLAAVPVRPERVLRPEVARAVRAALVDVVEHGTARRARGALRALDGSPIVLGGKTGTGDHRRKQFDRHGRLVSSEVESRSATLAFLAGERHFGVLTAYVDGPDAADYTFTSSLPAQVLRLLAPALEPLVAGDSPTTLAAANQGPPT